MTSKNDPANNHPGNSPERGVKVSGAGNKSDSAEQQLRAKNMEMTPEEAEAYRLYLIEKNQRRFSKAAAVVSEITCANCGMVCQSQAKFCNRCGKGLIAAPPPPVAAAPSVTPPVQTAPPVQAARPAPPAPAAPKPARAEPVVVARPERRSNSKRYLASALAMMILAALVYAAVKTFRKPAAQVQSAAASEPAASPGASPSGSPAVDAAKPVGPNHAGLIASAKAALADGYRIDSASKSWGRIADARMLLEQIPSDAPEFPEAKSLLSEVDRREAEKEKWDNLVARELHASNLERTYAEMGKAIDISLAGEDKSVIKLDSTLMSKQIVDQMTSDLEFISSLREIGFTKAVFTGANLPTWTYDLETSELAVSGSPAKVASAPAVKKPPVPAKTSPATTPKVTRTPTRPSSERFPPRRHQPRLTEQERIEQAKERRKQEEKARKKREKELKKGKKGY